MCFSKLKYGTENFNLEIIVIISVCMSVFECVMCLYTNRSDHAPPTGGSWIECKLSGLHGNK